MVSVSAVAAVLAGWCLTLIWDPVDPTRRPQDILLIDAVPSNAGEETYIAVALTHTLRIRDDGAIEEEVHVVPTWNDKEPLFWHSITFSWSGSDPWTCNPSSETNPSVVQDADSVPVFHDKWLPAAPIDLDSFPEGPYSETRIGVQPIEPIAGTLYQEFPADYPWFAKDIRCYRQTSLSNIPSALAISDPVEAVIRFGDYGLVGTRQYYRLVAPRDWTRLDGSVGAEDGEPEFYLSRWSESSFGIDLDAPGSFGPGMINDIIFWDPDRQRTIDTGVAILTLVGGGLLGMVLQAIIPASPPRRPDLPIKSRRRSARGGKPSIRRIAARSRR